MKWFVSCFFSTLSCQFIKKKQISCMLIFSVLCKNAYIPAIRVLSRIHSSCAFIISICKICQKEKVTFSLVISTAGNKIMKLLALVWHENSVTNRYVVLFFRVYTPACSNRSYSPHLKKRKSPVFVPVIYRTHYIMFFNLLDHLARYRLFY